MADIPDVIAEYDREKNTCDEFVDINLKLFKAFIAENSLQVYDISGSVLDREEVLVCLKTGKYQHVHDIDNLMSIRVLTFFEDETTHIAKIVKGEFKILKDAHEGKILAHAKHFGYHHRCYVIKLLEPRLQWIEYRKFKSFKLEIRIQSLMQHAWFEIHGMLMPEIPPKKFSPEIMRASARVVGLMELVDRELNQIKGSIRLATSTMDLLDDPTPVPSPQADAEEIPAMDPPIVEETPMIPSTPNFYEENEKLTPIPLSQDLKDAIVQLVLNNDSVRLVDRNIADYFDLPLKFDEQFLEKLYNTPILSALSTAELQEELLRNLAEFTRMAGIVFGPPGKTSLDHVAKGTSMLILAHLLLE